MVRVQDMNFKDALKEILATVALAELEVLLFQHPRISSYRQEDHMIHTIMSLLITQCVDDERSGELPRACGEEQ